jgi:hypothetical protein
MNHHFLRFLQAIDDTIVVFIDKNLFSQMKIQSRSKSRPTNSSVCSACPKMKNLSTITRVGALLSPT